MAYPQNGIHSMQELDCLGYRTANFPERFKKDNHAKVNKIASDPEFISKEANPYIIAEVEEDSEIPKLTKPKNLKIVNVTGLKKEVIKNSILKSAEIKLNSLLSLNGRQVECMVCMSESANCIFDPCGHGGVCQTCAINCFQTQNACCLICRAVYT